MSRIPDCLLDTENMIQVLQKNIRKLEAKRREEGDIDDVILEDLRLLCAQVELLQENAGKYQAALEPLQEPEVSLQEEVLHSYAILKTNVDVLEKTRSKMKVRLTCKDQSAFTCAEINSEGKACLVPPYTLPLFIPNYIRDFQFDSFKDLLIAVAQVWEAYCKRCEYVKKFEEKYSEKLLRQRVEKDYACTCLEMEIHISSSDAGGGIGLMKIRILYPLDDVRAKDVYVNLTGRYRQSVLDEARQKAEIFKKHPFFKAFEIGFT